MVEGMGTRQFGDVQNKKVPGGLAGVLFASPKKPYANDGEIRVSIAVDTPGVTVGYIMNDGINGNKNVILGTCPNANQAYPFKFLFTGGLSPGACTYDIYVFNNYAPCTIVDLDTDEVEVGVGF